MTEGQRVKAFTLNAYPATYQLMDGVWLKWIHSSCTNWKNTSLIFVCCVVALR